jgi:sugar phosphate isomerase/epimerase
MLFAKITLMFFGVSTLIFAESVDISKKEIDCIKNSGFDFIEISSFHSVSPEMLVYIKTLGMKIASIHSNFLQTDVSSFDEVLRSGSIEILKSNILTAKRLGAGIIVVHPGGWCIDKSILDAKINTAIRSFAEIAEFAGHNDVRVAIENLPPEFLCDNIEDTQRILNGVRRIINCRDSIGICLDTGHANLSNILPEYIAAFGKDIITMHVHDNDGYRGGNRSKAEDDKHNIPGSGKIDWKDVFKKIYESGYDNVLMLELTDSRSSGKNINKILIKAREFLSKL